MTNILLVQKDKFLESFLRQSLESLPVQIVESTASTRVAAESLKKYDVDIAIIDFLIPETSGIDITKQLKKTNESLVIILLMRVKTPSMIERAFRIGATDILSYPCDQNDIQDTVLHRISRIKKDKEIFFHEKK